MGESKAVIVIVVSIIALKLFAAHYYLKTKSPKKKNDKDKGEEGNDEGSKD